MTAKLSIACLSTKAGPQKPPPDLEAQAKFAGSPEDWWHTFNTQGQAAKRELQVEQVFCPGGSLEKDLLTTKYRGYSFEERVNGLSLVKELVGETVNAINLKLTLVDPEKLRGIVRDFLAALEKAANRAEATFHTSELWNTLTLAGCDPEFKDSQERQFKQITELTNSLFPERGTPSGSSSPGLVPTYDQVIPGLAGEVQESDRLSPDTSDEEPGSASVPEKSASQDQAEAAEAAEAEAFDSWGPRWKGKDNVENSPSKARRKEQNQPFVPHRCHSPEEDIEYRKFLQGYIRGHLTIKPGRSRIHYKIWPNGLDKWLAGSPDPSEEEDETDHIRLIHQSA